LNPRNVGVPDVAIDSINSTQVSCPSSATKHSSTFVATSEKSAKFTPVPSKVAPNGYGRPGHISILLLLHHR
jgi:hypothetical protein